MAVGVALLPKCPACWSVYASLSSLLGVSFVIDEHVLLGLTLASLALALWSLASLARRSQVYTPLAGAALGSVGVCVGKFVIDSEPLTYLGLLALLVASLCARRGARRGTTRLALGAVQN